MTGESPTTGIVYMAFGRLAADAVRKSIASMCAQGHSFPVLVVGDTPVGGADFARWDGESPYDETKPTKFKFRAGRVKPLLVEYAPWDRVMYVDADTTFVKPVHEAFDLLNENDLVVTQEMLSLGRLYNMKLAGWELNIVERDVTVVETGGDDSRLFVNSGVFLYKKSARVRKLFKDWRAQWGRFQEWDEQLALMRAIHKNPEVRVHYLSYKWNSPHRVGNIYIFHPYGRGIVRAK